MIYGVRPRRGGTSPCSDSLRDQAAPATIRAKISKVSKISKMSKCQKHQKCQKRQRMSKHQNVKIAKA